MATCRETDCCNPTDEFHSDQNGFEDAQNCRVIQIITTELPDGIAGMSYEISLDGFGGSIPYIWSSVTDLPPELDLSSDGILSGTTTQADDFQFSIQLTDANGNVCIAEFNLHVDCITLSISQVISDDMESYTDGAALDGLFNIDGEWCSPFSNHDNPESDTPYLINVILVQDDMESYNDGDPLNSLNGGIGWTEGYVNHNN